MFKRRRFFFSASMIAVLFLSVLFLSNDVSAKTKKCPIELPKTILSLYMLSDLVVIADVADEKILKSENENPTETNSYYEIERKLDISRVFKGQNLKEVKFVKSEYRPVNEQNEPIINDEEIYVTEGYNRPARLEKGKRYLFFLSKSEDETFFSPIDYRFGARELTLENANILEKRLDELGKIVAVKRNQIKRLADWLVRLTEDDATRWDGAASLSRSFSSLGYEEGENEPVTLDENFNEYSPLIAKQITAAQKERLSTNFIASVNGQFFGSGDKEYDYAMADLVKNWDKVRLAIYGFGILQAIDKANDKKMRGILNFIADMSGDQQLYDISYEYEEAVRAEEETVREELAEVEGSEQTEIAANATASDVNAESEIKAEAETPNLAETSENASETVEKPEEPSPAQIREQILQKFINRYQEALARNFEPAPETEENMSEIIK